MRFLVAAARFDASKNDPRRSAQTAAVPGDDYRLHARTVLIQMGVMRDALDSSANFTEAKPDHPTQVAKRASLTNQREIRCSCLSIRLKIIGVQGLSRLINNSGLNIKWR